MDHKTRKPTDGPDPDREHLFRRRSAVSFGAIGPALAKAAPWPRPWTPSPDNPRPPARISRTLFVGLAMIETMAIYCLVIALLLLFANPFVQ
jgi:F-type H+-transporting ATPase subunit c